MCLNLLLVILVGRILSTLDCQLLFLSIYRIICNILEIVVIVNFCFHFCYYVNIKEVNSSFQLKNKNKKITCYVHLHI